MNAKAGQTLWVSKVSRKYDCLQFYYEAQQRRLDKLCLCICRENHHGGLRGNKQPTHPVARANSPISDSGTSRFMQFPSVIPEDPGRRQEILLLLTSILIDNSITSI